MCNTTHYYTTKHFYNECIRMIFFYRFRPAVERTNEELFCIDDQPLAGLTTIHTLCITMKPLYSGHSSNKDIYKCPKLI